MHDILHYFKFLSNSSEVCFRTCFNHNLKQTIESSIAYFATKFRRSKSNIWIINEFRFFHFTRLLKSIHLFHRSLTIREIKQTFAFFQRTTVSKTLLQHSKFSNFHDKFSIRIIYLFRKFFKNSIYLFSKTAFVFCFDDNFNNISSHNLRVKTFNQYSIFTSSFLLKNFSKFLFIF